MKSISLYLGRTFKTHETTDEFGHLPLLLPHLFKGVGNVERADLFVVLKLEEFVSTVSGHVHEDIGAVICEQSLGTRYRRIDSSYMEGWFTR